jgi:hypothetical protein
MVRCVLNGIFIAIWPSKSAELVTSKMKAFRIYAINPCQLFLGAILRKTQDRLPIENF